LVVGCSLLTVVRRVSVALYALFGRPISDWRTKLIRNCQNIDTQQIKFVS